MTTNPIDANKLLADEALMIVETVRDSILLLDQSLRVVFANKSFFSTFNVIQEDTIGKFIYDIGDGQWNIPALKVFIEETLSKEQEFHDYKVSHNFPNIGERIMLLNGIRDTNKVELTLLVISDITDREKAFDILQKASGHITDLIIGRENKMIELKSTIGDLNNQISELLLKHT